MPVVCLASSAFTTRSQACEIPAQPAESRPAKSESAHLAADSSAIPHGGSPAAIEIPGLGATEPKSFSGLKNVVAFGPSGLPDVATRMFSGAVPEGDKGFASMVALGVKTLINVDGAPPDLERAKHHGIRVIHLPVGYAGFDETRKLQLVRAARDALVNGNVYLNCHHGQHRSAAAVASIGVCLGWGTSEQMVARMRVCGTSPIYTGLFAVVASSSKLLPAAIDAVSPEFPSLTPMPPIVDAMIEIDELMDSLKAAEAAEWMTPAERPELIPAAQAARMADIFRGQFADATAKGSLAEFAALMGAAQAKSQSLEDELLRATPSALNQARRAALSEQLGSLARSCKGCHEKFRN